MVGMVASWERGWWGCNSEKARCKFRQARSGTGYEKARSPALLLTSSSTSRGPPATAHKQGTSGRQHEQGTSSNLQRSSRRSSSLRSRTSLRELEVQARRELAVQVLETQARAGPGGRWRHKSWVAGEDICRAGLAAATQVLGGGGLEEHVLGDGGASNFVAQVLGDGRARPWRQRSKQLGGTGPGRRRSASWAAAEQAIGRRGSWASEERVLGGGRASNWATLVLGVGGASPGRRRSRSLATRAGDGRRKKEGDGYLFVTDLKLQGRFCKIRITLFLDGGSIILLAAEPLATPVPGLVHSFTSQKLQSCPFSTFE